MFDVASCLSDAVASSDKLDRELFSTGHQMLHGFMTVLASFRNQESRYLQPLLNKAAAVLSAGMQKELALPIDDIDGRPTIELDQGVDDH